MAIYSLSARWVKRSAGQSVVASAAYRAGERLHDSTINRTFDYAKREDEILLSEFCLPETVPAWAQLASEEDGRTRRERFWNEVEKSERRKDSTLAREIRVALPNEQTEGENEILVRAFVKANFTTKGIAADLCIHKGMKNAENPHAHILTTTRTIDANGFGKKARDLHGIKELYFIRQSWEKLTNESLKKHTHGVTPIDCRTLKAQSEEARRMGNIERFASLDRTPQIHLGSRPSSDRLQRNYTIIADNEKRQKSWREILTRFHNVKGKAREVLKTGTDNLKSWLEGMHEKYMTGREKHEEKEAARLVDYMTERAAYIKDAPRKTEQGRKISYGRSHYGFEENEYEFAPAPAEQQATPAAEARVEPAQEEPPAAPALPDHPEQEEPPAAPVAAAPVPLPVPAEPPKSAEQEDRQHEVKPETHWEKVNREKREARIAAGLPPPRVRKERKPRTRDSKKELDKREQDFKDKYGYAPPPLRTGKSKDRDRGEREL